MFWQEVFQQGIPDHPAIMPKYLNPATRLEACKRIQEYEQSLQHKPITKSNDAHKRKLDALSTGNEGRAAAAAAAGATCTSCQDTKSRGEFSVREWKNLAKQQDATCKACSKLKKMCVCRACNERKVKTLFSEWHQREQMHHGKAACTECMAKPRA